MNRFKNLVVAALAGLCLALTLSAAPAVAKNAPAQWSDSYSNPSADDRQVDYNIATTEWLAAHHELGQKTTETTNIGQYDSTAAYTYNGPVSQSSSNATNAVGISTTSSTISGPVDASTITITPTTSQDSKSANQDALSVTRINTNP